jgi:hypothetical protein
MSTLRLGHTNRQHYIGVDDQALLPGAPTISGGLMNVAGWVWDTGTLAWVKGTAGGGGGGGAVTIVNGGDVTEGNTADAGVIGDVAGTVSAKLRGINTGVQSTIGLGIPPFDTTALAQTSTIDVWTFRVGGVGGTLVSTVTITYTDSTKATISTVVRT